MKGVRATLMRLILRTAFLWLVLLGGTPFAFGNKWDQAQQSTVYIFFDVTDPATGAKTAIQGTGFVVSRLGYVLTTSHLLRDWNKQSNWEKEKNPIRASLGDKPGYVSGSPLNLAVVNSGYPDSEDVALLKLPDPDRNSAQGYSPVPICLASPQEMAMGDAFLAFGFPLGQNIQPVPGILGTKNAEGGRWAAAAAFAEGMSGGPVYDTAGNLIGLINGGVASTEAVRRITPIRHAENLLRIAGASPECASIGNISQPNVTIVNKSTPASTAFIATLTDHTLVDSVLLRVVDIKTGAPIPYASVTLTNTQSGAIYERGNTNEQGEFIFKSSNERLDIKVDGNYHQELHVKIEDKHHQEFSTDLDLPNPNKLRFLISMTETLTPSTREFTTAVAPPTLNLLASRRIAELKRNRLGDEGTISRYANLNGPETAVTGRSFPVTFVLKERQTEEEKQDQAAVTVKPVAGSTLTPEGKLIMKLNGAKNYWDIDADLVANGFSEKNGRWTRRLRLPRVGNSEAVRFVLTPRPKTHGQKWITLRLWHKGQPLGSVSRPIEVQDLPAAEEATPSTMPPRGATQPRKSQSAIPSWATTMVVPPPASIQAPPASAQNKAPPAILIGGPARGADLEISIQYDDPDQLGSGLLTIRSPHRQSEVSLPIKTSPKLHFFLEKEYARLVEIGREAGIENESGKVSSSKEKLITATRGIGSVLYREYVPEQIKNAVLSLEKENHLTSIQITTNSPVMPWELVLPDKRGDGSTPEFFGIAFRLARWSTRNSFAQLEEPVPELIFKELHAFAPAYVSTAALPAQDREIESLRQVRGFLMHEASFESLKQLMRKRIDGFVHFAGHGSYSPDIDGAALYSIRLSVGHIAPDTWGELAKNATFGNPFFFFNACHTGRSQSYGGFVQGWGPVILSTGAGGFIGGQWSLLDDAAAEFAKDFYTRINKPGESEGVFVADVLREVRRRFYETGDPTYLAYAFYGSANLRIFPL